MAADSSASRASLQEAIEAFWASVAAGEPFDQKAWLRRYPEWQKELTEHFAKHAPGEPSSIIQAPTPAMQANRQDVDTPALPTIVSTGTWDLPRSFGEYELLQEIARGGMGIVYRARHIKLNRLVALKVIANGQFASRDEVTRFRREAQAASTLDHPNIVPIYEVGEQDGQHFFTMKLIDGGSLTKLVMGDTRQMQSNDRLAQAAELLSIVARAVHHAHQRGILHRDIKPANILLQNVRGTGSTHAPNKEPPSGDASSVDCTSPAPVYIPMITDFGLARRIEGQDAQTRSGTVVGTPSYMAPEQARAEKVLTTAVDVYSLGAVLYELLTSKQPFQADTPIDTMLQVLDREPIQPSKLNRAIDVDLETICLKCLQKDPQERYGSAEALADDLDHWRAHEPIAARPMSGSERAWRWCRRNPAIAGLVAAVALTLIAGSTISAFFAWRADSAAGLARTSEMKAIRNLYLSQMSQAWLSWQAGEAATTAEILNAQLPEQTGGQDIRGFEWHYLNRLTNTGSRELQKPYLLAPGSSLTETNQKVMFRPGTAELAWVRWPSKEAESAEVVLADTETGTVVGRFPNLGAVTFSSDGKYLAGCTSDNRPGQTGSLQTLDQHLTKSVTVWDAAARKQIAALPQGRLCAFSPDQEILAVVVPNSGGSIGDGTKAADSVLLWNWKTGKQTNLMAPADLSIQCLAYSPDGKRLAVGGTGTSRATSGAGKPGVRLWDVASGKEVLALPTGGVKSLAFSADGKLLSTASYVGRARLWDAQTGNQLLEFQQGSPDDKVSGVAFLGTGNQLVTASDDHQIRVWDAGSGMHLRTYRGHSMPILSMATRAGGDLIASVAYDGSIRLWDATRDQEARTISLPNEGVLQVGFQPSSSDLWIVGSQGMYLWPSDPGDRKSAARFPKFKRPGPGMTLHSASVSSDARRLVTTIRSASGKGAIEVDVYDADVDTARAFVSPKRVAVVGPIALRPDGRELALAGSLQEVWDLESGKPRFSLHGDSTFLVTSLAYSHDGHYLAVAESFFKNKPRDFVSGLGHRVLLMDVATGVQHSKLEDEDVLVNYLTFSGDGRQVFGVAGRRVYRWDVASHKKLQELTLDAPALLPAFTPDGQRLASAGRDGQVFLWDMTTGQRLLKFPGLNQVISSVVFSPDGTRLAVGGIEGANGSVKVFDATPLR